MKVKAYKFENSCKVELTAISRVKRGPLVDWENNYFETLTSGCYYSYVRVNVYEHISRYHFEVCILDKERNFISRRYAYSSSKECDMRVVACALIKMHQ